MGEPGRPCFCQGEASKPTYGKLSLSPVELLFLPLQVPSTISLQFDKTIQTKPDHRI